MPTNKEIAEDCIMTVSVPNAHDLLIQTETEDAIIAALDAKDAEIERLKTKNVELLDHANAVNSDCEQLEVEVERLKAENQRYERLFTSREQDHKELCERYDQLEAQLSASEEKRKVLGEEVNFIRHMFDATEEEGTLVWTNCDNDILEEYGQLKDATDAASAMEAP